MTWGQSEAIGRVQIPDASTEGPGRVSRPKEELRRPGRISCVLSGSLKSWGSPSTPACECSFPTQSSKLTTRGRSSLPWSAEQGSIHTSCMTFQYPVDFLLDTHTTAESHIQCKKQYSLLNSSVIFYRNVGSVRTELNCRTPAGVTESEKWCWKRYRNLSRVNTTSWTMGSASTPGQGLS